MREMSRARCHINKRALSTSMLRRRRTVLALFEPPLLPGVLVCGSSKTAADPEHQEAQKQHAYGRPDHPG